MEVTALLILILINGFFAMSEIGLVSARRARLQPLIDRGDRSARLAAELGADPTRFLSTVQIGITSVALLSGIVGEATLAPPLAADLRLWGMPDPAAGYVATGLVVALVTYFSIVVGELVPKRIGQLSPERIARLVAPAIHALSLATKPFVWLLTVSTRALLTVLRIDDTRRNSVTEEEIHAVLAEGTTAGVIEEQEHRMVRNLFRLDDRAITSIMTPRSELVGIPAGAAPGDVLRLFESAPHSRYPVYRDGIHDVVGVVSARALLLCLLRGEKVDVERAMEPPVFVPEGITGMELLESFRSNGTSVAFVVDEYGSLLGMVTLHDVLEAITGEMPEGPDDLWAVRRDDGSWLLDGQIPIPVLVDRLGIRTDGASFGDYETVGGLIMHALERVPNVTDRMEWEGWRFEVVDMDRHRVDKVLASRVAADVGD